MRSAMEGAARFDVLILDGKPNASDQTREIAKVADLFVIPTGPTIDDLHPGVILAHALRKKGVSGWIAFAMVETISSCRETTAAREYLTEAGYPVLNGEVPVSTAYGAASDAGRAITETSFRTLNARASILAQSVIDRMADMAREVA